MQKLVFLALLGANGMYGASLQAAHIYNRLVLYNKTEVNINVTVTSQTNPARFLGTMGPEKSVLLEYPYTYGATFESLTIPKLSLAVQFGILTEKEVAAFALVLERNKLNVKPYVKEVKKE